MEISKLDPDQEYEDTSTFYHGFGCTSNLEGILEYGALVSPGRREVEPDAVMREGLYEDLLRHAGEGFTQENFSDTDAVERYLEEHKDDLLENGGRYTQWLAEENKVPDFEVPDFMGKSLVWVSRDGGESARNYATSSSVPGAEHDAGGHFKLELPEEAVLQFGVNGGVPGKIPLEFAEELRIQEAGDHEYAHIWADFVGSEYDVEVNSIE